MQFMKAPAKRKRRRQPAQKIDAINFGPLPGYLGYQIRQAQTMVFRDLMASIAKLKVTPGEYSLLTLLDENPGISQVDLAAVYRLDKSTLSLAVARLLKRGLVRRTRSREDKRYYALGMLPPGRALLRRVRARVEAQERAMDAVLRRGEREHLIDMLRRISRALNR
jgi:DNA-binding MarR family transcriptional regulator